MRSRHYKQAALGLLTSSVWAFSPLSQAAGNINGTLGMRSMDHEYWDDVYDTKQQVAFGVLADYGLGQLPLYASAGIQASVGAGSPAYVDTVGTVANWSIGLKLMPRHGVFRPYLGAGVALVQASSAYENCYSCRDQDDDDSDISSGYYANVGFIFRIGKHFNLGVDVRAIRGTSIELLNDKFDADSVETSL